jgi:hypothetical protein
MSQILSKSIAENSFADHLKKEMGDAGRLVLSAEGSVHTPWKQGHDDRRLYRWEIIPREEGYILIHIFPGGRLMMSAQEQMNRNDVLKMGEGVRYCCNTVLLNLRFLAEWFFDDINSFCISFLYVPQWREISEMYLRDLQKNFYHRINIKEAP